MFSRESLPLHESTVCMQAMQVCSVPGCKATFTRQNAAQHESDSQINHYRLLQTFMQRLGHAVSRAEVLRF